MKWCAGICWPTWSPSSERRISFSERWIGDRAKYTIAAFRAYPPRDRSLGGQVSAGEAALGDDFSLARGARAERWLPHTEVDGCRRGLFGFAAHPGLRSGQLLFDVRAAPLRPSSCEHLH